MSISASGGIAPGFNGVSSTTFDLKSVTVLVDFSEGVSRKLLKKYIHNNTTTAMHRNVGAARAQYFCGK